MPASPDAAPAADSIPAPGSELLTPLSSYTYANDLLGRRETISQGGDAFGMLKLGQNQVEVADNDRSEVTGAVYRSGDEARQTFDYAYDAIGNRRTAMSSRVTGQELREEKVERPGGNGGSFFTLYQPHHAGFFMPFFNEEDP